MGEPIYCGTCRAYLGNTAHDCASPRTSAGGSVDLRDARIAELESALAGLVDALPRCLVKGCERPALVGEHYNSTDGYCREHAEEESVNIEWADTAEAAERALGTTKKARKR